LNTRQRGFQQATNKQKGLMFPCGLPLGGCFVFLEMGASILFFVFPLFWVLWFIYDWRGFIKFVAYGSK
jgi:hypothetical protein